MTVDLSTKYLGLDLAHPVVPSASPLTGDIDHIHALVAAGASAIVLPSLFEEQIEHNAMAVHQSLELGANGFGEAPDGFFPQLDDFNTGPKDYLTLVRQAKNEIDVPVIASLNGTSTGGWILYARILADEGIDALELNTYQIAAGVNRGANVIERGYLRLVETIRDAIEIPLAVKIGPYFSSTANMAGRLVDAGADALVIFNRLYQPDIDTESLEVIPKLALSEPSELRLVLRWLAILHGRIDCDLAVTTGVHEADDAVESNPRRRHSHDDGVSLATSRSGQVDRDEGRARSLARRTRVCIGRTSPGQHELQGSPRSVCFRTSGIHADTQVVRALMVTRGLPSTNVSGHDSSRPEAPQDE